MATTIVADHLESLLLEIEYASQDIENCVGNSEVSPDEVEQSLLHALKTCRQTLEVALSHAQRNGVPKLAIDAA